MFLPLLMFVALLGHWAVGEEVGILSGISGYSQIVTSSTLQWVSSDNGHVPENAVVGATIEPNGEDDVKGTVWVCRARAAGMWVAGRLTAADKSKSAKCTVSMHGEVSSHSSYQVLQNVEDGGKLRWDRWDKYNAVGGGTVAGGKAPYLTYVARRKTAGGPMSHDLGKVDTTRGLLGKIIVVEADGQEKEYEDGEVLVETEPIRYEMHDVKFNTYRARYSRERMTLGSANLRNEDAPEDDGTGGEVSRVDTVIAYRYNLTVGWGHGHAILTGLPVKVRLANGTTMDEFKWANDAITNGESTYQVETFLAPGRGVNVTLVGNWTESNIPYTAVVTAIYADNTKKSRSLVGMRRELGLRDVRPDFGPVYYLHNYTHVPTTTTTTTSTTTQKTTTMINTTKKTTTSTEEPKPIPASPMEEKPNKKKGAPAEGTNVKGENQSMMSDGPGTERNGQNSGTVRIGPAILLAVVAVWACVFST